MDPTFAWLALIAALLVAWVVLEDQRWKRLVRRYLQEQGCTQVHLTTRMFTGRRQTISLELIYLDPSGQPRHNACVVETTVYSYQSIHLEHPLANTIVDEPVSKTPANPNTSLPPELGPFLGDWGLVSSVTDGVMAPAEFVLGVHVVIHGSTETVYAGEHLLAEDVPFSVDFSVTPHATTDFLPDGTQIRGITRVEGDTLTSCVAPVDAERPREFTSLPGSGHTLRVFKRLHG